MTVTARSADNAGRGSVERRSDAICAPHMSDRSVRLTPQPNCQSVAHKYCLTQKRILDCKEPYRLRGVMWDRFRPWIDVLKTFSH